MLTGRHDGAVKRSGQFRDGWALHQVVKARPYKRVINR
jgi:hypothetical protein